MEEAEYIQTQQQLLCLVGIIKDLPLKEFLHKIDICETVSPLINPILYMKGADNLTFIKRIAEKAQDFQNTVMKYEQALKDDKEGRK